jgi:hypothetical protein
MKSGPYAFHVWMKSDPHPPAETGYGCKEHCLGSGSQLQAASYQKFPSKINFL